MKQDIRIDFSPEAVLIGNGDFPTHSLPLQLLNASPFTVCCDGAANHYLDSGRIPNRIVGDGDSLREEYKREYASILHLNPDQETNDQTKAIHYLTRKGIRSVAILGATGKREDHTLGNISLLIEDHRLDIEARIYTELAKRYKGTSYEQVLNAHATKSLSGEYLLPLPEAGERLMSAGEVGAKLGISSNLVGKLTNKHGLKTDQYGKWMHDKSPYSSKEVPSFRYKECVVDKLREILAEM